jgi:hypothetical protein
MATAVRHTCPETSTSESESHVVLFDAILRHGNAVLKEWFGSSASCIPAAAVGVSVLEQFNIVATELPVQALALNSSAMRAWEAGEQWWSKVEGACVVAMGNPDTDAPPGHWAGHLVVIAGRTMLDLTADQASRPKHSLKIPALRLDLPAAFFQLGQDQYEVYQPDGPGTTAIGYRPAYANTSYKNTSLWIGRSSYRQHLADVIVGRIKDEFRQDLATSTSHRLWRP